MKDISAKWSSGASLSIFGQMVIIDESHQFLVISILFHFTHAVIVFVILVYD